MAVSEEIREKVVAEATSATPNYDIDYNDAQFQKIESDKNQTLTENEHTYDTMIDSADKFYEDQKQATKDWEAKQSQIQQDNTDFAIEKIEQQKEQAHKDYLKEQSGAYVDWQKQSNQYGANAEKMASAGLDNSGYSESLQVSMYNTYQNRVATARESFERAKLNYENNIKDAQLQNNAALAEIAYQSLQQQLELSLQGFQYKNQLINEKADKKLQIDNIYYQRWQDRLNQINTENAMKESIRQYEDNQKWQTEQNALDREHQEKLQLAEQAFEEKMAEIEQKYKIEYLNASTEKEKELLKIQHQNDIEKLNQQLANEKALLKYEYDLKAENAKKTAVSGSSGGSSSGGSKVTGANAINKNNVTSSGTGTYSSVDMQSVLDLGMGPISGTTVANLVNAGKAYIENNNGTAVVKKNTKVGWAELPTAFLKTGNAGAWKK